MDIWKHVSDMLPNAKWDLVKWAIAVVWGLVMVVLNWFGIPLWQAAVVAFCGVAVFVLSWWVALRTSPLVTSPPLESVQSVLARRQFLYGAGSTVGTLLLLVLIAGLLGYPQSLVGSTEARVKREKSREISPGEVKKISPTGQNFAALLQSFPSGDLVSPLTQIVKSYRKVTIRANTSSYTQAKVLGQWFTEARWGVVEISDTLVDAFPRGITIRAPYHNGDAENVHVALCKLGYRVKRELFDTATAIGVISPASDSIVLEIGDLTP